MKKHGIIFLAFALLLFGCAAEEADPDEPAAPEMLELTMEEVAEYNGEDGNPAYVVVNGGIYDVTGHPQWSGGEHGGNMAGTDITEMLDNNAPHGRSKLSDLEKVGIIVKP